ncbi:MAG: hypothetical protein R3F02_19395 [Thiolinea sp.]
MRKILPFMAGVLLLGACTAIPVKTLYKLATTDMMVVDPVILRAGVSMPDWVAPRPEGVKMALGMQQKSGEPVTERFILESIPAAFAGKSPASESKPGYKFYAYRISSADIQRFKAFRETLKAKKAESGGKTKGSLSIGVDACRKTELPEGKIPVTSYLRLDAESGYLPLVVDYDLRKPVAGNNLAELIPPC